MMQSNNLFFPKKTFVIKLGGEIIDAKETCQLFCEGISKLIQAGIQVILVHGGGKQITELQEKLGHKPKIINGRRITDETTLAIVKMVLAGINIDMLSMLKQIGVNAIGLNGVDGNIMQVSRRPPQHIYNYETGAEQIIDYGYVGDIQKTDPSLIQTFINYGLTPIFAPLAADEKGVIYNMNADIFASAIASALKVDKLIFATNVEGVLDKQNNLLPYLSCEQARLFIKNGTITGGMIPKIESVITAIESGLQSACIFSGKKISMLLEQLIQQEPLGTIITA